MKIFSAFDTRYKKKLLQEKQTEFWEKNVCLIQKSKYFLIFKVIIPAIISLIIGFLIFGILYYSFDMSLTPSIVIAVIVFIITLFLYKVFKHSIDYTMDYVITCPSNLIIVDQTGLFKRRVRSIECSKIKSISTHEKTMIRSIFNNGSLVFMTDGSEEFWEIIVDFVHNPLTKKDTINTIIRKNIDIYMTS